MGNKSEAALPEYNITLRIQPTNDSIMYLTPWSFSSDESPVEKNQSKKIQMRKLFNFVLLQMKNVKGFIETHKQQAISRKTKNKIYDDGRENYQREIC